jgi:methylase of polypeptide subunit release factors
VTAARDDAPLNIPDRDTARRMWDLLEKAQFTTSLPLQLADVDEDEVGSGPREPRRVAVGLRRTAGGGSLETLTRLFLLGAAVPAEQAQQAVAPTGLDLWTRSGLLTLADGQVRAALQLAPVQGRLFAADARHEVQVRPDHVMGYCGSTATLARVTLRRQVDSMLDLGTGCGVHAVLAAGHAGRAVGTDLNPRAVNVAAFNARLNALDNVETLVGDLFAPVRGRRFGLVVSNPPFVTSPETDRLCSDSGRAGDELLRELLRDVPAMLEEGGYCQITCEWAHPRGQDWRERLAGWVRGGGCDAWVLRGETSTAAAHAERWAGGDEAETPRQWAERMERWLAYYERLGIEEISTGLVFLRRRSAGPNWFFCDEAPRVGGDVGRAVELGFALRDWAAGRPDEAVLQSRLRINPGVRWRQTLAAAERGWAVAGSEMTIHEGLQFTGQASQQIVGLLDRCRGEASLAAAIDSLEAATGNRLDRASAVRVVRELVAQGFLLPAE